MRMRLALCLAGALAALGPPVAAQMVAGVELGSTPPEIQAYVSSQPNADRTRIWVGDFTGDDIADAIEQTAYAYSSGNAVVLVHRIYTGNGRGFSYYNTVALPGGIESALFGRGIIDLTLFKALPQDPRCCPSGRETVRLQIQ